MSHGGRLSLNDSDTSNTTEEEVDKVKVTGQVLAGIWFENKMVHIRVVRAKNLAGSNTYVKGYLLPDSLKKTKQKTKIVKNTRNPTFNEIWKIKLSDTEFEGKRVWLSVWDSKKLGQNNFLGEYQVPLNTLDLNDPLDRWYPLRDQDYEPEFGLMKQIIVAIKFDVDKSSLVVNVKKALGLPFQIRGEIPTFFVKIKLHPNGLEQNSPQAYNVNPTWDATFLFEDVTAMDLISNTVLEISVWSFSMAAMNQLIGIVRLCSPETGLDINEFENSHWDELLRHPNQWVEACHDIRHEIIYPSGDKYKSLNKSCPSSPKYSLHSPKLCPKSQMADFKSPEEGPQSPKVVSKPVRSTPTKPAPYKPKQGIKSSIPTIYSEGDLDCNYVITGRALVRIECYVNMFRINILRAEDIVGVKENDQSDPFMKVYLLVHNKKELKWETDVIEDTIHPQFEQKLQFEYKEGELHTYHLLFSIWHCSKGKGLDKFLGEFEMFPSKLKMQQYSDWFKLKAAQPH